MVAATVTSPWILPLIHVIVLIVIGFIAVYLFVPERFVVSCPESWTERQVISDYSQRRRNALHYGLVPFLIGAGFFAGLARTPGHRLFGLNGDLLIWPTVVVMVGGLGYVFFTFRCPVCTGIPIKVRRFVSFTVQVNFDFCPECGSRLVQAENSRLEEKAESTLKTTKLRKRVRPSLLSSKKSAAIVLAILVLFEMVTRLS